MQDTIDRPSPARRHWKTLVAFLLLLALAVISLLWYQYQTTKKPLDELIPEPLGRESAVYQYGGSIYGDEGLARPVDIALSPSGDRLYVDESDGQRAIRIFDRAGEQVGTAVPPDTTAPSRSPLYMAVSRNGNLYVADRHADTIYIFAPDGEYIDAFEPAGVPVEDWNPMGVAFDGEGNLYTTNVTPQKHRVMVFDKAGVLKLEFGSQGSEPGQFWFPNGIAVDDQGRIYVADGNNGRVQAFDLRGELLWTVNRGYARGDLAMPRDVTIDHEGRLLVTDTSAHVVKAYDISGDTPEFLFDLGGHGVENDNFRFPIGLAAAGNDLYVADSENGRVQVWSY